MYRHPNLLGRTILLATTMTITACGGSSGDNGIRPDPEIPDP